MRKVLLAAAIAVLAGRLFWMYLLPAWTEIITDFPNYYTAAWAVRNGKPLVDLYDPVWFEREKNRAGISGPPALFNYFTPFSALILWPLAGLPPLEAKQVWTLVNIAAFAGVVLLTSRLAQVPFTVALVVALVGGDALGNNFTFGQFYIVLTLFLVGAMAACDRWPTIGGAMLSLATITKVFPFLIVPYFVWKRHWKTTWWTVVCLAILVLIGIAVLGWIPHRTYLEEVWGRAVRGEIQDPYNIRWNTLQALLRRTMVAEPGLNPSPIVDLPELYFFLRSLLVMGIVLLTFKAIRRGAGDGRTMLVEYGALIAMISLITPSQASYHQVLFFPGILGAVASIQDIRAKFAMVGLFALICSNYMGATIRFESGWWVFLAFPRVYLIFVLWIVFVKGCRGGPLWPPLRLDGAAIGILVVISCIVLAWGESNRWRADLEDRAQMVRRSEAGLLEVHPTVGKLGLFYSSLRPGGFSMIHPSAFHDGLVYETRFGIVGRLADRSLVRWPGGVEPTLGPESVLAIIEHPDGWAAVERGANDAGWRELFRRASIIHELALSPYGESLAFAEVHGSRYRISEWTRPSGTIRPLLEGNADYRDPAYSPDNRSLAFATNERGNWDVATISREAGRVEYRTSSLANDFMPVYSLDGKQIYFASDRRRGYRFTAIYRIDVP